MYLEVPKCIYSVLQNSFLEYCLIFRDNFSFIIMISLNFQLEHSWALSNFTSAEPRRGRLELEKLKHLKIWRKQSQNRLVGKSRLAICSFQTQICGMELLFLISFHSFVFLYPIVCQSRSIHMHLTETEGV